jgi:hypothetical protein
VGYVEEEFEMSERQACRLVGWRDRRIATEPRKKHATQLCEGA